MYIDKSIYNCTIKLLKFIIQSKLLSSVELPLLLYLAIELSLSYKTSKKVSRDFWDFFKKIPLFLIFFLKNKHSTSVKRFRKHLR